MAKQTSDFILSSLRNRILLAVAALVVFNSIFGLLGYLAVSFLISEAVYAVVTAVAAMTSATAVFGWWLSNEILRPIEVVSLLARSLERSPSASLPKTTGASETDELLSSLHRNSQQLQNLIGLMDDVASGKTDAAMAPLPNPDRLSLSFQKLVAKVVESIKAKQQLDALQGSVSRLRNDVAGVRSGELAVEFRGDLWQVSEIADALKYLIGGLSDVVRHVEAGTASTKEAAEDAQKIIRAAIDAETTRTERLQKAVELLSDSPSRFAELTRQLESAVNDAAACVSPDDARPDEVTAVARLRSSVSEARKQLDQLRERTNVVSRAARRTGDIVRRANLLALNTAVLGVQQGRDSLVANEVSSISSRAETVHKDMSAFNENLTVDIVKINTSIETIWSELSALADATSLRAGNSAEIEKNLGRIGTISNSLKSYAAERSAETEAIVKTLNAPAQSADLRSGLKMSEQNIETILNATCTMRDSISDLRPPTLVRSDLSIRGTKPATETVPPAEQI